ncbi:LOW QUALITY PROTEIN: Transcription initiation factor IIB [Galemys pyrenaicus]|uniref:Transcription initiation factor IIB n=1 Tax=Galemys pyrenaicus TaxID=202257 RepID=A0A8J6AES4_GALPY|nr:LOW QUALITY PROTEIN: Transcription initiation factor IIB [Galemys pyrenaicus]
MPKPCRYSFSGDTTELAIYVLNVVCSWVTIQLMWDMNGELLSVIKQQKFILSWRFSESYSDTVWMITIGNFMSRFCSSLCLPKQVQMAATHTAHKAVELDLVPGRSLISVAATAIYMESVEKRTQKEIGNIAAVADVIPDSPAN